MRSAMFSPRDSGYVSQRVAGPAWLLRHLREVSSIEVGHHTPHDEAWEAFMTVWLDRERVFFATFDTPEECRDWLLARRSLRGVPITYLGRSGVLPEIFTAKPLMEVLSDGPAPDL